jgi:hypothetical protein
VLLDGREELVHLHAGDDAALAIVGCDCPAVVAVVN